MQSHPTRILASRMLGGCETRYQTNSSCIGKPNSTRGGPRLAQHASSWEIDAPLRANVDFEFVLPDALDAKLVSLLADVIGTSPESVRADASQTTTPGWDSVTNLGFIAAVEDEFGVSILTAEAMQLHSLADMSALLRRKGVTG